MRTAAAARAGISPPLSAEQAGLPGPGGHARDHPENLGMRLRFPAGRDTLRKDAVADLVLGVESAPDRPRRWPARRGQPSFWPLRVPVRHDRWLVFTISGFMAVQATGAMAVIIADVPAVHAADDPARALFTLEVPARGSRRAVPAHHPSRSCGAAAEAPGACIAARLLAKTDGVPAAWPMRRAGTHSSPATEGLVRPPPGVAPRAGGPRPVGGSYLEGPQ
jgi:hypothetical protein